MEKIKVNMSPNPLDVQTIHASQNDTEARQWEFELHNNGELIDTSDVKEQMVFKSYKGGTEQLLPENTSTPTTSPFLGDIKYPQGLLTDQEFTYRQSPTESDGLAKITDIKGNTLVWNQLVGTNVNGLNTTQGTTFTLNSNGSIHVTGTGTGNHFCEWRTYENPSFILVKGHKYLVKFKGLTTGIIAQVSVSAGQTIYLVNKVDFVGDYDEIFTPTQDGITASLVRFYATNKFSGTTDIIMQLFDLTQMGLDITDPSEFTSLFSLPYYDFNQGSLLSFNGNGIKTVGKNQFNSNDAFADAYVTLEKDNGEIRVTYDGTNAQRYRGFFMYRAEPYVNGHFLPKQYTVSFDVVGIDTTWVFGIRSVSTNSFHSTMRATINSDGHYSFTFNPSQLTEDYYLSASRTGNRTTAFDITFSNIQIEFGAETSYVPYKESTLSLPISTYFPTGMKSAYNSASLTDVVRDELSQTKAIKKVKQITFDGSSDESWSSESIGSGSASGQNNFYVNVAPAEKLSFAMNNMAVPYALYTPNYIDGKINAYVSNGQNLNFYPGTNITSIADFRTWLSNHPLTVNFALPTDSYEETDFTTASLVTENAEIPLSNEDGVLIGKCTEELSAEPGFHDAKIKLSDSDGECYSNKLQLHVERSPQ